MRAVAFFYFLNCQRRDYSISIHLFQLQAHIIITFVTSNTFSLLFFYLANNYFLSTVTKLILTLYIIKDFIKVALHPFIL